MGAKLCSCCFDSPSEQGGESEGLLDEEKNEANDDTVQHQREKSALAAEARWNASSNRGLKVSYY